MVWKNDLSEKSHGEEATASNSQAPTKPSDPISDIY